MTLLFEAGAFALGVVFCIRLIAAFYAILDFWYAIGTYYPRVLRGLLVWGGATLGVAWLLGHPYRTAFEVGLAAFLLFYLSLYGLRHLTLRPITSSAPGPRPSSTDRS